MGTVNCQVSPGYQRGHQVPERTFETVISEMRDEDRGKKAEFQDNLIYSFKIAATPPI